MADETPKNGHNSRKALDFNTAANLMKTLVATGEDKAGKARGDLSAAWKKIDDLGVNKAAAKDVRRLMTKSPATVSDYLRTFIGLLNPLGLGILRDMVDVAQEKTAIEVPLIDTPSVDA